MSNSKNTIAKPIAGKIKILPIQNTNANTNKYKAAFFIFYRFDLLNKGINYI